MRLSMVPVTSAYKYRARTDGRLSRCQHPPAQYLPPQSSSLACSPPSDAKDPTRGERVSKISHVSRVQKFQVVPLSHHHVHLLRPPPLKFAKNGLVPPPVRHVRSHRQLINVGIYARIFIVSEVLIVLVSLPGRMFSYVLLEPCSRRRSTDTLFLV